MRGADRGVQRDCISRPREVRTVGESSDPAGLNLAAVDHALKGLHDPDGLVSHVSRQAAEEIP